MKTFYFREIELVIGDHTKKIVNLTVFCPNAGFGERISRELKNFRTNLNFWTLGIVYTS